MYLKMVGYRKSFNKTKYMSFLIKDDESLEKHNKTLNKVSNSTKKGSDSERVYNEKYLKSKIKSYKGKISTNFCDDRIPKQDSHCICLSVILLDSVFKMGKSDFRRIVKDKKITRYIIDDLETSSYESNEEY